MTRPITFPQPTDPINDYKFEWPYGMLSFNESFNPVDSHDNRRHDRYTSDRFTPTWQGKIENSIVKASDIAYLQAFYNAHGQTKAFRYRDRTFNQSSLDIQHGTNTFTRGLLLRTNTTSQQYYPVIQYQSGGVATYRYVFALDEGIRVFTEAGAPLAYTLTTVNGAPRFAVGSTQPRLVWIGSFDLLVRFRSAPQFDPLVYESQDFDQAIETASEDSWYRVDSIDLIEHNYPLPLVYGA